MCKCLIIMEDSVDPALVNDLKEFLVVGEQIEFLDTFHETKTLNLILSLILLLSFVYSLFRALEDLSFWIIFTIITFTFFLYYSSRVRLKMLYAITKFRVMKIEINPVRRLVLGIWKFSRYSDLHFSHAETIQIGVTPFNSRRFWLSGLALSVSWFILNGEEIFSFLRSESPLIPMALVIFLYGVVSLFSSLPLGSDRILVNSLSGYSMTFPLKKLRKEFIELLVDRSRTFLTYGVD